MGKILTTTTERGEGKWVVVVGGEDAMGGCRTGWRANGTLSLVGISVPPKTLRQKL